MIYITLSISVIFVCGGRCVPGLSCQNWRCGKQKRDDPAVL